MIIKMTIALVVAVIAAGCGRSGGLGAHLEKVRPDATLSKLRGSLPAAMIKEERPAQYGTYWVDRAFLIEGTPAKELVCDDGNAHAILVFDEQNRIMGFSYGGSGAWPLSPERPRLAVPDSRRGGPQNSRTLIGGQNKQIQPIAGKPGSG